MTDIISQLFGDDEYAYPHTAHIWDWCLYMQKKEDEARQKEWEKYQAAEKKRKAEYNAKRKAKFATAWPMEKQRRSRINWSKILPEELVYEQERYERFKTLLAMRDIGMTYREIGEKIGVTNHRASQIINHAKRYMRHPVRLQYGSPAEKFMAVNTMSKELTPRGKLIAHQYLGEFARENKRDWLFVSSR